MLPYTIVVLVAWIVFFVVWYLLGIPLGPGYPVDDSDRRPMSRPRSVITIAVLVLVASSSLFVWNRLPVESSPSGPRSSLWATGVLTIDQALGRLRRPGRHLHRHPVRGQRGPRRHRGHRLGRPAAHRPRAGTAERGCSC